MKKLIKAAAIFDWVQFDPYLSNNHDVADWNVQFDTGLGSTELKGAVGPEQSHTHHCVPL